LNADPNTPIGLVHDGAYIANLIEAFPYRKGVTINELTIREFINYFNNYQGGARMFFSDLLMHLNTIKGCKLVYTEAITSVLSALSKLHNIDLNDLRNEMNTHLVSYNMPAIHPDRTSIL